MAFEVGQRVGDYEIVQLLGVGGMGHVYRVRNVISDRTEAMKVLLPDLTAERDLAIRFISEIRTLASFDHPNIALLHTAFQSDNQLIMMMEFVEGSTLEQRAKQGPMTVTEVAGYTGQALAALSYAHERGVVHRDIKPANIMLTSHGVVKLMDFGIAKSNVETHLTRPGTTIGSLYYMSPEQVRGDAVDGRSDLYSVGILLYELLAGRRPFEAETTFSILNQQLNTPPQPPMELNPALPATLNDIILKALAKDPNARYQTAAEFREALRPFGISGSGAVAAAAMPVAAAPIAAGAGVAAAIAAADAAPRGSATAALSSAPPPFAEVPMSSTRPPAAGTMPPPQYAPAPAQKNSNKALWIATGVAAALLAMVGLAIGVPHLMKTHAAEDASVADQTTQSGNQAAATPPSDASASAAPQSVGTDASNGEAGTASASVGSGSGSSATPDNSGARMGSVRTPYSGGGRASIAGGHSGGQMAEPPRASAGVAVNSGALEEQRDRYTEISARASAVDSGISRLRRAQEEEGLGLRHDMESADNRMQSYLHSAEEDLRASNAASAQKNLSRAEEELNTLEKFMGK